MSDSDQNSITIDFTKADQRVEWTPSIISRPNNYHITWKNGAFIVCKLYIGIVYRIVCSEIN